MFSFKKHILKTALLLFFFIGTANAVELRTLVQFDFPSKISVGKNAKGVINEKDLDVDAVLIGGAELNYVAEFSQFHYGFGCAYKSAQKNKNAEITPATIPVNINLSYVFNIREQIFLASNFKRDNFSPYLIARVGTLFPLSTDSHWWRRPFHFFAEGGFGIVMPFNIGLEVNYNFSSMRKSFSDKHTDFRVNSGRLGIQLSMGFELSYDRIYKPNHKVIEDAP